MVGGRLGFYPGTREPVKPTDLQRAEVMQGLDPTSAMMANGASMHS
jgi:hypothetical protein